IRHRLDAIFQIVNRGSLFEDWDIASLRNRNADGALAACLFIILRKLRSKSSRFNAHDWIIVGVVAVISIKNLNSEDVFFELICLTLKGLLDNKTQEAAQAF